MIDDMKFFVPFEKKDDDQRIVGGYATSEDLDSQGEIIRIEAIKKALPEYMKFANVREMHQYSAVGKAIQARFDDSKKALYIVCKVIDDVAWKKVKEGVYNGFSIGGKILKKVGNEIQDLTLSEISLVDRPANPSALFSLIKSDSGDLRKDAMTVMSDDSNKQDVVDHSNVFIAGHILDLTKDLVYLCEMYCMQEKDTTNIEKIISMLKDLATVELTASDSQKIADIANTINKAKVAGIVKRNDKESESRLAKEKVTERYNPNDRWTSAYFEQMKKVMG